jgi:DNA-directed RNA polymerase specialized sigma24 family protein
MTAPDTHRAIEAVWRIESAKLIAGLARIVRDVGLAEDLAQDALVIALEWWPESGIPNNPGAWLMATAKHRAIDRIRRNVTLEHKHEEIGRDLEIQQETAEADFDVALDDDVGDDLLRLRLQERRMVPRGSRGNEVSECRSRKSNGRISNAPGLCRHCAEPRKLADVSRQGGTVGWAGL